MSMMGWVSHSWAGIYSWLPALEGVTTASKGCFGTVSASAGVFGPSGAALSPLDWYGRELVRVLATRALSVAFSSAWRRSMALGMGIRRPARAQRTPVRRGGSQDRLCHSYHTPSLPYCSWGTP